MYYWVNSYIVWTQVVYQIMPWKYFPSVCDLSFHFLSNVFSSAKVLNLDEVQFSFSFYGSCFWCYIWLLINAQAWRFSNRHFCSNIYFASRYYEYPHLPVRLKDVKWQPQITQWVADGARKWTGHVSALSIHMTSLIFKMTAIL